MVGKYFKKLSKNGIKVVKKLSKVVKNSGSHMRKMITTKAKRQKCRMEIVQLVK
jgi:hypothetical protein